ncbi:MAG TPA: GxxExxY protein [Gemmatimonadaceae bacterium]|nr:GxxExxY protein [Gemmatimonadaceae bacterium]
MQGDVSKDAITESVIAAAIEVHRALGPGLLESAYKECLALEFVARGILFKREQPLEIVYKSTHVPVAAYRLDFVVDNRVVIEIKAQERLIPLYQAQLLTYLRIGKYSRGLLLNFGATRLADGIKRVVNGWGEHESA